MKVGDKNRCRIRITKHAYDHYRERVYAEITLGLMEFEVLHSTPASRRFLKRALMFWSMKLMLERGKTGPIWNGEMTVLVNEEAGAAFLCRPADDGRELVVMSVGNLAEMRVNYRQVRNQIRAKKNAKRQQGQVPGGGMVPGHLPLHGPGKVWV